MNLFNFSAEFTSEESCRNHFKLERDKIGVVCVNCQNTTHYWIKADGVTNVSYVITEPHYVVERLCSLLIYLFWCGTKRCFY